MRRRQLLAASTTITAGLVGGCLETVIDRLDPHDEPDLAWTPRGDGSVTDQYTEAAEALAFVSLTLEGCVPDLPALTPERPTPIDGAPPDPPVTVALADDVSAMTASALSGCTPVSSSDDSYLEHPNAFIEESHPDATVVLAIAASDVAAVSIDTIGVLPDGAMFVDIETDPGPHTHLHLARVGYWNDPTGLTVALSATTPAGDHLQGTYELSTAG